LLSGSGLLDNDNTKQKLTKVDILKANLVDRQVLVKVNFFVVVRHSTINVPEESELIWQKLKIAIIKFLMDNLATKRTV
jgi:rRNA-processing protein FCF1